MVTSDVRIVNLPCSCSYTSTDHGWLGTFPYCISQSSLHNRMATGPAVSLAPKEEETLQEVSEWERVW